MKYSACNYYDTSIQQRVHALLSMRIDVIGTSINIDITVSFVKMRDRARFTLTFQSRLLPLESLFLFSFFSFFFFFFLIVHRAISNDPSRAFVHNVLVTPIKYRRCVKLDDGGAWVLKPRHRLDQSFGYFADLRRRVAV